MPRGTRVPVRLLVVSLILVVVGSPCSLLALAQQGLLRPAGAPASGGQTFPPPSPADTGAPPDESERSNPGGVKFDSSETVPSDHQLVARVSDSTSLTLRLIKPEEVVRHEAPSVWSFTVGSMGTDAARGRLVFRFDDGSTHYPTVRSRPLVLGRGEQTVAVTFPPLTFPLVASPRLTVGWELPDGNMISLGAFADVQKISPTRTLTVGWFCTTAQIPRYKRAADLWKFSSSLYSEAEFRTEVHSREADSFPHHPLGLLSFDVVLVTGDAFRELAEPQLTALQQWVDSGGAVGLVPTTNLRQHHLDFFENLFRRSGKSWRAQFVGKNKLEIVRTDPLPEIPVLNSGLGIAAIYPLARPPETHTLWTRTGRDLWRVPSRTLGRVSVGRFGEMKARRDFLFQPDMGLLLELLKPRRFEMLPTRLLVALAVAYLLLIGPVDWRLFGRLRRRRWTWIWLPSVTICFAVAIVLLTQSYFGSGSSQRRLFVVDVASDGEVLRANQFELSVLARNTVVEHELQGEIYSTIDPQRFQSGQRRAENPIAPIEYQGSYPLDYTTRQTIPMWSAVVNRRLWIPGSPAPQWVEALQQLDLNFDALRDDAEKLLAVGPSESERTALRSQLMTRIGAQFSMASVTGRFSHSAAGAKLQVFPLRIPEAGAYMQELAASDDREHSVFPAKLARFRVASPSGGGHTDDLPITASRNALHLEVHSTLGDDLLVVRCMVRRVSE